jgi:hypothetical protein
LHFFYRQTYELSPVYRPQSSQFSFEMGPRGGASVKSGFSYHKGSRGQIQVTHGASFPVGRVWQVKGDIRYNVKEIGASTSLKAIEKNIVIKRDLHCWTIRGELRDRPGVREFFFRLDLKTDSRGKTEPLVSGDRQFYPAREGESEK